MANTTGNKFTSFLGVFLSDVEKFNQAAVAIAQPLAPLIPALSGVVAGGSILNTILGGIAAAAHLIPQGGDSANATKKAVVTAIVQANHPGTDPTNLSTAIDALITALHALQAAAPVVAPPAVNSAPALGPMGLNTLAMADKPV